MEAKSEVDVVISRSQAYLAWPAWAQAAGQAKLQAAQCPGRARQAGQARLACPNGPTTPGLALQ